MITMVDNRGNLWAIFQTYSDGSFRAYQEDGKSDVLAFKADGWSVSVYLKPFQLKPLTEEGDKCEPIKVEMINDRFQVTVAPTSDPEDMVDAALALLTMAALNKRKG